MEKVLGEVNQRRREEQLEMELKYKAKVQRIEACKQYRLQQLSAANVKRIQREANRKQKQDEELKRQQLEKLHALSGLEKEITKKSARHRKAGVLLSLIHRA